MESNVQHQQSQKKYNINTDFWTSSNNMTLYYDLLGIDKSMTRIIVFKTQNIAKWKRLGL
jgi:hypothetical protein